MLSPIVIPGPLAALYLAILVIAAVGMGVWTAQNHTPRAPGRHRSAANIAAADAISEALEGEVVATNPDADIDPAPELAAAPIDALDPAMPLADVEAFLAMISETRELESAK